MSNSSLYKYNQETGIIVPDVSTLREDSREAAKAAFGEKLNTAEQTPQGRIIEAFALLKADILGMNASVANQLNISYATGRFLDNIGSFYGVERNPATHSKISIVVTGDSNTVISAGSVISSKKGIKYEVAARITIPSETNVAEGVAIAVEEGAVMPYLDDESSDYDPVTTITTGIIGWKTVEGREILSVGSSEESDDAFRNRILKSRVFGVSFVESISSELNKISGVRSSFVYDNGNGYGVLYTTGGKIIPLDQAKAQNLKGVVIPAHHVMVIADCDSDSYAAVGNAIFKTKSVGSGIVKLYDQNGDGFGDWDIEDPSSESGWKYTKRQEITDEWYGASYTMYFIVPVSVTFSIVIDVVKNKYSSDVKTLISDVKKWIHQWALGNIEGVDGLGVNQPIYSHECAAAVSAAIPEIKIMDCGLYECNGSDLKDDDSGEIVPPAGVVRKSKIQVNCIQKGNIVDDNIIVRVYDAAGTRLLPSS